MQVAPGMTRAQKRRMGTAAGFSIGAAAVIMAFGIGSLILVVGLVLSLTGIGALIGIPMVLGGLAVMLIGGPIAFAIHRRDEGAKWWGPCPYCGLELWATGVGFDCPACAQRIVNRGGWFMTVAASQPPPS